MPNYWYVVAPPPPPPPPPPQPDVILHLGIHRHYYYNSALINCSFSDASVLLLDYSLQFDHTAYTALSPFLASLGIAHRCHQFISRNAAALYRRRVHDGDWRSFCENVPEIYLQVASETVLSDDQLAEMLSSMQGEANSVNRPASKASIDALEKVFVDESRSGDSCSVCLEELAEGEEVTKMPCSHVFHGNCIGRWLESSHFCPLCRYKMPTQ